MSVNLWTDKRRTFLGLPLSFTRYTLTNEKLIIKRGFLNVKEEEIRLYRVLDLTVSMNIGQRIFGLGTIHVCSMDKTTPEFDIKSVKKPRDVKNLISDKVEEERGSKGVSAREHDYGYDDEDYFH